VKKYLLYLIVLGVMLTSFQQGLSAQAPLTGKSEISSADLESHLSFLASPLLLGRMNGEPGLEIAASYIESQIRLMGLKPANGDSYVQPFPVIRKSMDRKKTNISIVTGNKDTMIVREPMYQIYPSGASDFEVEGEVVFAGYGIKNDNFGYNDFDGVKTEGKILVIMNRSPLSEEGLPVFESPGESPYTGIQRKIMTLVFTKARAVLFVADPKSGFSTLDEQYPGLAGQLGSELSLKGSSSASIDLPGIPKMIFVHRKVADELLRGTGFTLEGLQKSIDSDRKPHSFEIKNKKARITEVSMTTEENLKNIAGYVEGSDPVLKDEVVIFSAHMDHIGGSGDRINTGADDNASGCSALLELADAFSSMPEKPLRSVVFLWVSGEEIGLYGSKYYSENPLFPVSNTIADINIDMIGRVKGIADSTDENPMSGPTTVFAIACNQSSDLLKIAEEADVNSVIDFDYSLSGRNHPLQLFARSDHYNFVKKDIPVLFFSTGIHTDYHTPGDVIDKINFEKMELVTKAIHDIGFTLANRRERIVVDNPFSSW